ncbi:Myosin light chain 5 [Heterocephalus glaber]|uniref:Myosin light chain 5 n=1 Tax=Heterocephalus glaber TaxID=10181 RepID=G5BCK9_HETGA|nr:Myosin light chain 5 [Heterocephalus glaber]
MDKEDPKDTYTSLGKTNMKDDKLDTMLKEASGPALGVSTLSVNGLCIKQLLMSQADKMAATEVSAPHPTLPASADQAW